MKEVIFGLQAVAATTLKLYVLLYGIVSWYSMLSELLVKFTKGDIWTMYMTPSS